MSKHDIRSKGLQSENELSLHFTAPVTTCNTHTHLDFITVTSIAVQESHQSF